MSLDKYSISCLSNKYNDFNTNSIRKYNKKTHLITLITYFLILNQDLKSKDDVYKDFFDLNGDIYTLLFNSDIVISNNHKIVLINIQDRNRIITKLELSEILNILRTKNKIISIFDLINIGNYYNQLNNQRSKYNNKFYEKYCNKLLDKDPHLSYYYQVNILLDPKSEINSVIRNKYKRLKSWNIPRPWIDNYGPNYLLFYYS